ncbi:hypothetical protein CYMTET_42474 [Cymbomonas tetramitiformis]|uniref:dolichyl-P-Man:Man5GlcNAc2-PP-dolichol alpha-1,3-mannosyltransferase n=1 Tax=Cymbomonas tetramitiformis TaxID=36881 RepID=A0AAE0F180_9CHLO|nr:hypothetical protein CYMTET_42474 [Cymbomonas tetramitiformis]
MKLITSLLHCLSRKDTFTLSIVASFLFFIDALFCVIIFLKVSYTEIDWIAYMEEVKGYLDGERDYYNLRGQTGPLVYPGGFVYLFAALRWLTAEDVPTAQVYFIGVYLLNLAVVFAIYVRSKAVPAWALVLLILSKRVHSIFVLRLFNDGVTMLLAHISILFFQSKRWVTGLIIFSVAVSVKMNVLLFAPPLFLLLCTGTSAWTTIIALAAAAIIQVGAGIEFLLVNPWAYLKRSFDLGRKFIFFWSVNWKFLPEDIFLSSWLAASLLAIHLLALALFAHFRWTRSEGGIIKAVSANMHAAAKGATTCRELTLEHITTVLFTGNFIGIAFARSLHYQFYCWYFFSVPYLLWRTNMPTIARVAVWAAIEVIWNMYPSSPVSSLGLQTNTQKTFRRRAEDKQKTSPRHLTDVFLDVLAEDTPDTFCTSSGYL